MRARTTAAALPALLSFCAAVCAAACAPAPREVQARTHHASGALESEGLALAGADGAEPVRTGTWTYWLEDGTRSATGAWKDGAEDGPWTWWYPDGSPMAEGAYRAGRESGRWTSWHPNGALESAGAYLEGHREGVWIFRRPDGSIDAERTGVYQDDRKVGEWHEEGEVTLDVPPENGGGRERVTFRGGLRHGPSKSWYADGARRSEGDWALGLRTGVWSFWHEDGSLDAERSGRYQRHERVADAKGTKDAKVTGRVR